MNKKLILLDQNLNVITSFDLFPPYTVGDNYTIIDSKGNMYMIEGYSLIVDGGFDPTAINVQDVVNFKIEIILNKFTKDCDEAIYEGFHSTTMDAQYAYGEKDQAKFTRRAVSLVLNSSITTVEWHTLDKGVLSHTRDQFIAVLNECDQHEMYYVNALWQIRQNYATYTTLDQVDAIGTFKDEVAKLPPQ